MKRSIPLLCMLLLCMCINSFGQGARMQRSGGSSSRSQSSDCPKLYIGTGTGLDNPSGLLGFHVDVPITGRFSLGTGLGLLTTWGYKTYGEGRFYFDECNRGWALGLGGSYSTGVPNVKSELQTTSSGSGTEEVTFDALPATNVFLSGYRFWNLGRNGHRIYLQVGYSKSLTSKLYNMKSGHTLTSTSETAMNIIAPGGIIVAVGFSFGVIR